MTPDETVKLLAVARAAYPAMAVVEGMPLVWHGGLGDLQYAECARAVVEHARDNTRIVTVADIRSLVQASRRAVAGEVRREQIEAAHPSWPSQEVKPMPDWFRSTMEEHRRRARAERKQAEDDGEPVTFGSQILSALDGMKRSGGASW